MLYGVVLAGGKGERFWPLSRRQRPKQFLKLTSENVMLQETIDRVLPLIPLDQIRIVTGAEMVPLLKQRTPSISEDHLLAEPCGRNTCAAVGLAATKLIKEDPEAVLAVLPADHLIRPSAMLLTLLKEGANIAEEHDCLITLGIVPTRAETGYGYIRLGENFEYHGANPVYRVSSFAEKPRPAVAKEYYFSGNYLWNSGMFVWSAKSILAAIEDHQPEMAALLKEYGKHVGTNQETEALEELYAAIPSVSVDIGVLEKASNVVVMKADLVWDDVGDWNALARYRERDGDNNVRVGKTVAAETYETTIFNDSDGLVASLGVSDLVIVRSGEVTLVVHKTKTQAIKGLLAKIQQDDELKKYL